MNRRTFLRTAGLGVAAAGCGSALLVADPVAMTKDEIFLLAEMDVKAWREFRHPMSEKAMRKFKRMAASNRRAIEQMREHTTRGGMDWETASR
jgi:hypothetical protein